MREGELRRLVPLTLAYGLTLASVYVLKPVRNALFLDNLGIEQLPYVLILVALIGGVTASFYARFTRSIRIDRLILGTLPVLMSNLLIFRWAIPRCGGWIFYVFYVWVNLYGLMSISLLWLLANSVFNPREARRLFGFIGTGGIAGAVLGGIFTSRAAESLGTENLLVVCIGIMGICLVLVRMARPLEVSVVRRSEGPGGVLSAVARFDLLRMLGVMAGIAAVVAAIADVQFNQIASEVFPSKDAKTAFFGTFFAYLNVFAFLFQLLVTPRILRSLGVGAALLFLPLTLGAGSLGVLLIPGLIGGIAVKVGDGGFRHSIYKSVTEILFLPVPSDLKQRTKVFLDTTVDNLATGLGAILVLLLTQTLGLPYRHLSFLSLGFVLIWLGLMFRVRRAYVDTFRRSLERREIDLSDFRMNISDAATINALKAPLASQNERQVVYALDMLTSVQGGQLTASVEPLLAHASAEVRRKAVQVLHQDGDASLAPRIKALLNDVDPEVRMEAMHFLCHHGEGDSLERMAEYLDHPEPTIQSAALGCIAAYGSPGEKELIDEAVIQAVLDYEGEEGAFSRAQAAKALGSLNNSGLRKFLVSFMNDPSPLVVREAIYGLGQAADFENVPWLLEKLADKQYRVDARDALAAFGPRILDALVNYFDDERGDDRVRRNIPRVMSEIQIQASVDLLLDRVDQTPPALNHHLLKALNRLRTQASHLIFDAEKVDAALVLETRSYHEILQIRDVFRKVQEDSGIRLLEKALAEKQDQTLDRIFRLLAFCYPPEDIYHAYLGIVGGKKRVRASAIEFLDNVLDREKKAYLFPFLDPVSTEAALEESRELFEGHFGNQEESLAYLIQGRDPWLKACAINCVNRTDSKELAERVWACRNDSDPLVSETAQMVIRKRGLQAG